MVRIGRLILGAFIALAGLATPAAAQNFDFYVLSLSWSPSWCAGNDRDGKSAQCDGRRPYTFITHGLWPQNERGWPEYCASREPDRVPSELVRPYFDMMPSIGLAGYQWRKHGTCSGLDQRAYFETLRAAYRNVKLPPVIFDGKVPRRLAVDEIEALMTRANPGLRRDGVAVTCDNGQLSEIRVCMSKSLDYRACAEVDRKSCRARMVSLPALP